MRGRRGHPAYDDIARALGGYASAVLLGSDGADPALFIAALGSDALGASSSSASASPLASTSCESSSSWLTSDEPAVSARAASRPVAAS